MLEDLFVVIRDAEGRLDKVAWTRSENQYAELWSQSIAMTEPGGSQNRIRITRQNEGYAVVESGENTSLTESECQILGRWANRVSKLGDVAGWLSFDRIDDNGEIIPEQIDLEID